ncbi:MAG: DNA-binding LytR/AlgR family response regulator [Bacteroidia bacterium]|jgi:DNA-binding LytR/AlgR family response regulator
MTTINYKAVVICDQLGTHLCRYDDIVCMIASGSYTQFNIYSEKELISKKTSSKGLGHYEKQLSKEFVRLGRGVILNLKYVRSIMVDRRVVFTIPNGPDVVLDKAAYRQFRQLVNASSDQNPQS